jgi:hypothetical protein
MIIPDLTKYSAPILVAVGGLVFAIFALIHNERYIGLGLITFAYGLVAHWMDNAYWDQHGLTDKCNNHEHKHATVYVMHIVLLAIWLFTGYLVYPRYI